MLSPQTAHSRTSAQDSIRPALAHAVLCSWNSRQVTHRNTLRGTLPGRPNDDVRGCFSGLGVDGPPTHVASRDCALYAPTCAGDPR